MKIPILTRLAFLALGLALAAPLLAATPSIVGTWSGIDDKGVDGGFVFEADGNADILKNGVSFKQGIPKDQGTITYRFDATVKPHALDIILSPKDRDAVTLQGIVEFLSENQLRVRISPKHPGRPADFDGPADQVIVLDRQSVAKPDAGK